MTNIRPLERTDLAGVSARAASYRAARDRLRKHPQAFAKAGRALPNRTAMPELLRTLTRTARGTGVTMGELTVGAGDSSATASSPGITSVGLQLSFDGDYGTQFEIANEGGVRKLLYFLGDPDEHRRLEYTKGASRT